jgi:hypothetical protein
MTRLCGTQLGAAAHFIVPRIDFKDQSSSLNPLMGDGSISDGNGGDAGELGRRPAFITYSPGANAVFGLGSMRLSASPQSTTMIR